jgi:hypothetical protein
MGPFGEEFSTFAISARCPGTGKYGVAISTRPMGVGSRCPFIKPRLGVVVTMAATDPRLGPLGLKLLDLGYSDARLMRSRPAIRTSNIARFPSSTVTGTRWHAPALATMTGRGISASPTSWRWATA